MRSSGAALNSSLRSRQLLPQRLIPVLGYLPLADAEVNWKTLVVWRRGRAGGALKALLDALFTNVTPSSRSDKASC